MFELRIEVDFPAGHHLVGYPGDCARPHGHNWKLEIFVRARKLDSVGIAVDFKTVKAAARELIRGWDHQDLNSLPEFKNCNPSAENLARIAHERLSSALNCGPASQPDVWVSKVAVWESDRAWASYFEEGRV